MHPLKNFTSFKCFIEEVESSKDIFGRRHWDLLARLSPFGMWSQRGRLYIFKQKVFMVLSIFFFQDQVIKCGDSEVQHVFGTGAWLKASS